MKASNTTLEQPRRRRLQLRRVSISVPEPYRYYGWRLHEALTTLATACTQRLTQRAQHREKQVTLPIYPGNSPGQRRASAPALSAKQPPAPDDGLLRMTFK